MSEQLPEGMSARLESEFWHRQDDIAMLDDRDVFPDADDAGLFDRLVNWGRDPVEHFRDGADDIAWTGWAAYVGYVTPSSLIYSPSMYLIGHNAAARAFRYITVTPAAETKHLYARVSATYRNEIGIMIDDGVDAGDGQGANNFLRFYLTATAVIGVPINYEYQYRTGGGAVNTITFTHTLIPNSFFGLWLRLDGTFWTNWSARAQIIGEADISGALLTLLSGVPGGRAWTPARIGIYYRNFSTSTLDRGVVDWLDHNY